MQHTIENGWFETIHKQFPPGERLPNLPEYDGEPAKFTWQEARAAFDGLPGGALNIAFQALDIHLRMGMGDKVALRWLGRGDNRRDFTYVDLIALTNRFANVLRALGIGKGDRVFSLLGRVPELYTVALGTLKNGCVFSPLFSAFGPGPIQARLNLGDARVLVTSENLYRKRILPWREQMPTLEHVLIVDRRPGEDEPGAMSLAARMSAASEAFEVVPTQPDDMALLHFTSGTTGRPKGAIHVHEAVVAHHVTARYALDLSPDDVFWCTADPGWVTGTSYGIIAPLTIGCTMVVDEGDFDAERWYGLLEREAVTVWYTAPTAIRMLMRAGADLAKGHDLSALRFMASVGEPLNPEAVVWSQQTFGLPFHDNWWQTETGGIMIANLPCMDIKPGSMGRALPGIEAAIVHRRDDGGVTEVDDAMAIGELALRPGWPSMFRGYLHDDARHAAAFAGGWYLTGDLAMRDSDGYYWFIGRGDDVIKSAGHLIGPFEVESALLEHEAVAEAAVIGVPDPVSGEAVKAFVSLNPGFVPSEDLRMGLLGHARKRLGAVVAPKVIDFRTDLPRTRSGKIMRRLLKARELGLPEGDLSTLEGLDS